MSDTPKMRFEIRRGSQMQFEHGTRRGVFLLRDAEHATDETATKLVFFTMQDLRDWLSLAVLSEPLRADNEHGTWPVSDSAMPPPVAVNDTRIGPLLDAIGQYALSKGEGWRAGDGAAVMDAYQALTNPLEASKDRINKALYGIDMDIGVPAKPLQPRASNWMAWPGGVCPVVGPTTVEVMLRDGHRTHGYASDFTWGSEGIQQHQIVAWRYSA
jgi:hypothetical protein